MRLLFTAILSVLAFAHAAEEATAKDWSLRVRVLDPDGKPLAGVKVWEPDKYEGSRDISAWPNEWVNIARGEGVAESGHINFKHATKYSSGPDGVVLMGPFRPPVEHEFELYLPDFGVQRVVLRALHEYEHGKPTQVLEPKDYPRNAAGVVDLGDMRLPRGGTVSGAVIGPDGKPIENAWVAAQPFYLGRWPWLPIDDEPVKEEMHFFSQGVGEIRTARTDKDGRFTLKGLGEKLFVVAAWTDELPPAVQRVDFTKPDAAPNRPLAFALEEGAWLDVVVLEGADGKPVAGAPVKVTSESGGEPLGLGNHGSLDVFHGRTGADGKLRARGIPKKCEYVNARIEGPKGGGWFSGRVKAGTSQTAHFRYGELKVNVESSHGVPIAALWRDLDCIDSGKKSPATGSRGMEPWGEFGPERGGFIRVEGNRIAYTLICGTWKLGLGAMGHRDEELEFEITPAGIEKTIKLHACHATLKARLVDERTGVPVPGAKVKISYEGWVWLPPLLWYETTSDANGIVEFKNLRGTGAKPWLRAEAGGYAVLDKIWLMSAMEEDLGELRLIPGAALHGTVFADGKPAPGQAVGVAWVVRKPDGSYARPDRISFCAMPTTDAEGNWSVKDLKAGFYSVGRDKHRRTYEIQAGATVRAERIDIEY